MLRSLSVLMIAAAVLVLAGTYAWRTVNPPDRPVASPLVQMEEMGSLVSLRVRYADVKPFQRSNEAPLPFGKSLELGRTELLLIAKGECTLATDLRAAKQLDNKADPKNLRISLPAPRILNASINHALSQVWSGQTRRLDSLFDSDANMRKAIDAAYVEAELDIRRTCNTPTYINEAKKNAENVLKGLFARSGQSLVVEWAAR